jgi:sec-independent protein translocase protein TatA
MGISFFNIIIILVIILILFGAGRLPKVMGDLGKGIKSFKDGLKDENLESKKTKVKKLPKPSKKKAK